MSQAICVSLCTTEFRLEAGYQSAARLAQLIIGYAGGYVHVDGSARELILYTLILSIVVRSKHMLSCAQGYETCRARGY